MTPIFCCGFDCGATGQHWNLAGTGSSFSTSSPLSGDRSLLVNTTGLNTGSVNSVVTYGAGLLVIRFRVNFTTFPNTSQLILGTGSNNGVWLNATNKDITAKANNVAGTGAIALAVGVTYWIDYKVDTTANPWTVNVKVNGIAVNQQTAAVAADTSARTVSIGFPTSNSTGQATFDDVILSTTSGDYPIGNGKVLSFVPNADGTHTSTSTNITKGTVATPVGTAITSGTTDAFQWVNARPLLGGASDNTRLINQQTVASTEYVEVAFEDTTEVSPPQAVEIITADRQAGTQAGVFQTKLNDNGTEDAIANRGSVAGVTTDRYVTKQYATMVGGGAWTLARFNALKARFGYSSDATPDQYWRGIMIEADFPMALPVGMYGEPDGPLGQSQMQQLLGQ